MISVTIPLHECAQNLRAFNAVMERMLEDHPEALHEFRAGDFIHRLTELGLWMSPRMWLVR